MVIIMVVMDTEAMAMERERPSLFMVMDMDMDIVGLELCQVNIEGTIKTQGSSDGRDNLANEPVEVGVSWALNVQVPDQL